MDAGAAPPAEPGLYVAGDREPEWRRNHLTCASRPRGEVQGSGTVESRRPEHGEEVVSQFTSDSRMSLSEGWSARRRRKGVPVFGSGESEVGLSGETSAECEIAAARVAPYSTLAPTTTNPAQ